MTTDSDQPFVSRTFPKPRVALSACLEVEECRYNGAKIPDSFIRMLLPKVDAVPICPEVEIGLGVPRDTIRLVDDGDVTKLVQPSTDRDLTEQMHNFADRFLDNVGPLDGWILKSGSPSCGPKGVKVYAAPADAPPVRTEAGLFATHVLERHGTLAVESDGRLRNYPLRHHYLTQLYSFADLRGLGEDPEISALSDFHRRHKHLLMTYDQHKMRQLGQIAANPDGESAQTLFESYAPLFREALATKPSLSAYVNTLDHMYGHFKDDLSDHEREDYFALRKEYRNHRLPLHAMLTLLRTWTSRFEYDYFADQSLLEPYPRKLVQMRDSGKGIDF